MKGNVPLYDLVKEGYICQKGSGFKVQGSRFRVRCFAALNLFYKRKFSVAAFVEDHDGEETICLRRGETVEAVIPAARIPATLYGAARHNIQNAMAAVGLAHGLAIPTPRIAEALAAFKSDHSENPGRLNKY